MDFFFPEIPSHGVGFYQKSQKLKSTVKKIQKWTLDKVSLFIKGTCVESNDKWKEMEEDKVPQGRRRCLREKDKAFGKWKEKMRNFPETI